jgi:predicted nuclease of predicted toxin-antitoxin system
VKVLLDECLDWRLARDLPGHDVKSVQDMGWSGIKNGKLLSLAQELFEVFITGDRNLSYQQNMTKYQIAVVVLQAGSTRLVHLRPLMPKVLAVLPTLRAGQLMTVGPGAAS